GCNSKAPEGNICISNNSLLTITPNPGINDQPMIFNMVVMNTGFLDITQVSLTGTINQASAQNSFGISNTSASQQALPVTLTFDLPVTLTPGQSASASATWDVTGFPSGGTANLILTFVGTAAGYPPYNVISNPIPLTIMQDPSTIGLDPNATEPTVTKTASVESAFPGESVTWLIEIRNPSTRQMAGISLTDSVPGDLEIVSATTSSGASLVTGNLVDITTGPLAPGATVNVTIVTNISVEAEIPGIITNTACGSREGGTEVCGEAQVALGAGGLLPDTGIGSAPASFGSGSGSLAQRLPFAAAVFGVFFVAMFLSMSFSNRQRFLLALLALGIIGALIGLVLVLAGGGEDEEVAAPSDSDGAPPIDDGANQGFLTATPFPTEVGFAATPTAQPTVGPDALATIQSFPATATPYIVPTAAGPRRLDIPVLSYTIPLPIVELPQINGEWDVTNLGHSIGWLDNTTWLDPTWGNTVLVGHIQLSDTDPGPFVNLHRLVPGDEIQVIEGSNVTSFAVTEVFTAAPTDAELTHPTLDPTLTLITCTNWVDARGVFADRLIVRAIPMEEFAQQQTTGG
ncbi:MAG TPA: sortase, partial [Aggregatilineales bacterium]|nr:sortase [Aggregatilineales bacterium]